MRDSSRHVQGVPVTIVIEPENECFPDSSSDEEEEEEEEREEEELIETSTSSSICSGVYFNNTEIHVSSAQHPLQSRPALIGEPQGLNVPNGRPLPCPPKLVILGGKIEPRHCDVRSASHCDYRKLNTVAPSTPECRSPPCKRPKLEDCERQKAQTECFASRMIDCRHTILSEEQQMFVEAAAALKEASPSNPSESWHAGGRVLTEAPLRITTTAGALPPPPYRLPESVILKLLSKPQQP